MEQGHKSLANCQVYAFISVGGNSNYRVKRVVLDGNSGLTRVHVGRRIDIRLKPGLSGSHYDRWRKVIFENRNTAPAHR